MTHYRDILKRILLGACWAPAGVLLLHWLFAGIFGHEPYVDPVMHFLGGTAAFFFFRYSIAVCDTLFGPVNDLMLDLSSFGFTTTIAVLWEVGEFLSDVFLDTNIQHDAANIMRDLILGMAGGFSLLCIRRLSRYRHGRDSGEK